ncbi:MAG: RNA 2',3'-cyclic phosphodiesterase [Bacteroidota bacterium]
MKLEIRTFIAIKIQPEEKLQKLLLFLKRNLNEERIKWVGDDNLHLTLRFLGDTNLNQVKALSEKLESVALRFNSFGFDIVGTGFFKNKGQPQVLFVNSNGFEKIQPLVNEIEEVITSLGFEKEFRPFKPHMTIGRIKFLKDKRRFYNIVDEVKDIELQKVSVGEFVLYQSILRAEGPVYKPLNTFKLK